MLLGLRVYIFSFFDLKNYSILVKLYTDDDKMEEALLHLKTAENYVIIN